MNAHVFSLAGTELEARPSGALWWPGERLLCVSDLHFGKSGRLARRGGDLLPPYETRDTLARLEAEIRATAPRTVVCLGDSFDDLDAAGHLAEEDALWIARLQAGRRWVWAEGNHDPGPVGLGGEHLAELHVGSLTFRHIARSGATGEVSGHYHPKARIRMVSRPCFLTDAARVVLPAFGTYTGGLAWTDPCLAALFPSGGTAVLTGPRQHAVPMPVARRAAG